MEWWYLEPRGAATLAAVDELPTAELEESEVSIIIQEGEEERLG